MSAIRRPAGSPPEARGLARDGVRLLVATPDGVLHATGNPLDVALSGLGAARGRRLRER